MTEAVDFNILAQALWHLRMTWLLFNESDASAVTICIQFNDCGVDCVDRIDVGCCEGLSGGVVEGLGCVESEVGDVMCVGCSMGTKPANGSTSSNSDSVLSPERSNERSDMEKRLEEACLSKAA